MSARVFQTGSEEETIRLGRELAAELARPSCILLIGNLGAGKTTLAKGIVAGLTGISEDEITSPTFTLIHEYAAGIYHLDLYRLETEQEVARLGLDDLLDVNSILLVEWGERFPTLFPADRIEITIDRQTNGRLIRVSNV
ncbi:MAG TPA: tRNA (adenosine(37)-N6)-threonylcarbamoyltransferase complex ATPase subunit type 1 TsaE [Bryobacteraceae bacterium]|nr:tRNA (adenosine(37)-N6)-threonylcarbamoyltransferase complex ATPase subunit type 1 TsaE [Bryobacteraceae bacterium]